MNHTTLPVLTTAFLLLGANTQTMGIENLELRLACQDVVLSWPSAYGETYIVQYRPNLETKSTWTTLTNNLPAAIGTNLTTFVHAGVVQLPKCAGSGGSFAAMLPSASDTTSLAPADEMTADTDEMPSEPLAVPNGGVGQPVPLKLFPEGFDLTGYTIIDPATGIMASGASYSQTAASFGSPDPFEEGGGATNAGPGFVSETGFYRVVRNGVHLFGLTNGMVLSGVVSIPLELGLESTNEITGISFYSTDGAALVGANEENPQAPWLMLWDTAMVTNGTYSINVGVNFASDPSVTNEPIVVTVSNLVSFPNYFSRNFGDWMWLHAEVAVPEVSYEIQMFADETNYIGSFTGGTSDGIISFIWDLSDGQGHIFDSERFSARYLITGTGAASPSSGDPQPGPIPWPVAATNFFAREYYWSGIGKFVVAYSAADDNTTKTDKIGLMVSGGPAGEYGGVTQTLGFYGVSTYQLSPGNGQGSAFCMNNNETKTTLLSYLFELDYRNFYYFGHGSPSSIGAAPGTAVPTIKSDEFRRVLGNFPSSGKPANGHPYRFVFLDGCNTGSGNLCEQFGIPTRTTDDNYFLYSATRARAFLGFTDSVTFNAQQWTWRSLMLGGFFQDWMNRNPLHICVSNAVAGVHSQTYQKMPSSWIIHGSTNLQMNSY